LKLSITFEKSLNSSDSSLRSKYFIALSLLSVGRNFNFSSSEANLFIRYGVYPKSDIHI